MCKYTYFHFLCGGTKLKIAEACDQASTNYQGVQFCKEDPYPHVEDGKTRQYVEPTYGPGICSNIHCREAFGMIPREEANKHRERDLVEDDTPFDMSPESCQEREDVWVRTMLDEDQQMEAYRTKWPLPVQEMSLSAKTWLFSQHFTFDQWFELEFSERDCAPDDFDWRELNPKYLSAKALQHVTGSYLPASVTDPRRHEHPITTPAAPQLGPFRVKWHTCEPAVGFCKTCGIYHSKKEAKKAVDPDADAYFLPRVDFVNLVAEGKLQNHPHFKPRPNVPLNVYGDFIPGPETIASYNPDSGKQNETSQLAEVASGAGDIGPLPQLDTNVPVQSMEKWSADSGYVGTFDQEFQDELDRLCANTEEVAQAQATYSTDGFGMGLNDADGSMENGEYEMMDI